MNEKVEKVYQKFIEEAEMFFVTKYQDGVAIKKTYSECLDIVFGISKEMDSNRGIIAHNPSYGQGKTFFFDVLNHRYRRVNGKNLFVRTTAKELCQIYKSAGKNKDPQDELDKFIKVKNLFIDDIGEELKEGKEVSHYSNKLNVIRYVLLKRYEQWNDHGWRTFGSTNLTLKEFDSNYDGRVADRICQMCYFTEFRFMAKGSFRQLKSTRKLTQDEIERNWEKFKKPEVIEKMDLEKHFNELIQEPDEYFEGQDISFWGFTKNYLIEKGLLTDDDFGKIDEAKLDGSERILRQEVRKHVKSSAKHAGMTIVSAKIQSAMKDITKKDIYNTAENHIAKKKFLELRIKKHVFK